MRDPNWNGSGSPDTTYGKKFDPAEQAEPEPPTLGDVVNQRRREREKLREKRITRGSRI